MLAASARLCRTLAAAAAIAVAAGCAQLPQRAEATLAIVGATVVHPESDAARVTEPDATILIADRRIVAVGPRASISVPAGATVVDARGKWVIPGLVDGHVHFFQSGNLYTRPDVADLTHAMPYAQEVARNRARLDATFKVWLASGVTSVVDVGGPFWNFDVRDAARRTAAAPRVAVAGPLISMVADPKLDLGDPPIIKVASADEARALVARELARKPDYIKVWYIHQPGDDLAAQEAIVRATADAAHTAGVPLAVHATELDVAKSALRAGADYLVHSVEDVPIDDEFIALAKKKPVLYCPTLFVVSGYRYALANLWRATDAEKRLADPQIVSSMSDLQFMPFEDIPAGVKRLMAAAVVPPPSPVALANLRRVRDAGITIVMGTDAGNIGTLHGPSVFREMALMRDAGLTPLEVLRAATTGGARAMRLESQIGRVDAGRLADLAILDADPTADVANLSRVWRVVKDGQVYDPDALIGSIR
jgi:imidazolonepropionase-like amidohydrolase